MASLFIIIVLIFFVCSSSDSSSIPSEVESLLSFKSSLHDPMNHLSTWTATVPNCNWIGISCSPQNPLLITSIQLQSLNISGQISPSICLLPKLKTLNLAYNLFTAFPNLTHCPTLQTLNLTSNIISGTIPRQIFLFNSLTSLDLSNNRLQGTLPIELSLLTSLRVLNLAGNSISGTIPSSIGNLTQLAVLDLSQNAFLDSEIPNELGTLVNLEQLLLRGSGFRGELPISFTGLESLTVLDISQNNLTGGIPFILMERLVSFDVSRNRLTGSFPNGICRKKNSIVSLSLHTNLFTGEIPDSIGNCSSLQSVHVQNNGFSGNIPNGLWSLPNLKLIRAENNRFSGELPETISNSHLEQIQIDNNTFSGKIPHGLGLLKSMYRFSASMNGFSGNLPPNFCDSPVMSIINLSHNLLSGEIPMFTKCKKLVSLFLADNKLTGHIPKSLSEFPVLTYLDVSENNLTGQIPRELENLKLALFNVSFNRLSGEVPYSLISSLPASFLQGNPELCGPEMPNSCHVDDTQETYNGLKSPLLIVSAVSAALSVAFFVFVLGFFIAQHYENRNPRMGSFRSVFFFPLRVTHGYLISEMDEKSAVGNGAFRRVHIVRLPSGEFVVVKRLANFERRCWKDLKAVVKTLAKIRHKNVAKVLGFCHSDDSILVIYEFLQNGSLGDLICSSGFDLEWSVRLRIAIGLAQGLAYLHIDCMPHVFHRNVKSRNVVLDANFEPKLTDFALDQIVGEVAFQAAAASESASSCYIAPENGYTKKVTEKLDVYGFGVVLLELVTGCPAEKSPSSSEEESVDIVKWVRRRVNIREGASHVLDMRISGCCKREMMEALRIAVACTSVIPQKRPSMSDVLRDLQSLNNITPSV